MQRRSSWGERGAAAVEFALVLPVLLLILGGIVDFGRAWYTNIMLANAARDGVRAAIVATPSLRVSQGQTRAAIASGAVAGWQTPNVVDNCTASPPTITVETRATFDYFFVGVLPGVPASTTLQSSATMGCL